MKTIAAILLLLFSLPVQGLAAGESADDIEKELTAILTEMDAIRSELDRIEDLGKAPAVTAVQLSIEGAGDVAAPTAARIVVGARVEGEREWGKAERDVFSGGSVPLIATIPFLPGSYNARIELSGTSWKSSPAVDVPLEIRKGETLQIRLKLVARPGSGVPALQRVDGK